MEIEEARIKTEKERKFEENNKEIDESYVKVISEVKDQIIIKSESNWIVKSIKNS